jgi:hypothetical protein
MINDRFPHGPSELDKNIVAKLWDKICANFASNEAVSKLAADLQRIEYGRQIQSAQVANAAAAVVIKDIQKDLETVKNDVYDYVNSIDKFCVEICTIADKYNRPAIKAPKYNTIYLVPSELTDQDDSWDEWIAIPRRIGNKESFKWERLGAKKIDLSWVKSDFDSVNAAIADLQKKLRKFSKLTAQAILDKATTPIEELKAYINSPEFISYVYEQLPRATIGQDGLMTANSVAMLQGLALWANNDQKILGGGAMSADYVIRAMEYYGISCDDLKTEDECGHSAIYPEFNFPRN